MSVRKALSSDPSLGGVKLTMLSFVIKVRHVPHAVLHPLSITRYPSFLICHMLSFIPYLSHAILHPLSVTCYPSSLIYHTLSFIPYLSHAILHPLSVTCYPYHQGIHVCYLVLTLMLVHTCIRKLPRDCEETFL
jgi:hypothetical protein